MKTRFRNLWTRLTAKTDPNVVFQYLSECYSQPHRFYHNLEHIKVCLDEFQEVCGLTENADAVEIAIWFHDIIYDVHSNKNEENSAKIAYDICMEAGLSKTIADEVGTLIMATKHSFSPKSLHEKLITDIDLAILGRPIPEYDRYEANIRKEYYHIVGSEYRKGRTLLLQGFLARTSIYSLAVFMQRYQSQAVENLQRAIRNLKAD